MLTQTRLTHVVEAQQFDRAMLDKLFATARDMEQAVKPGNRSAPLIGKQMLTLFYEPSTRTRLSFEQAMRLLGGTVSSSENATQFSSAAKGETLEDTIRVCAGYHFDVIVIRHTEDGAAERAAKVSSVPIINAGDGKLNHPTQALLDLYTIQKEMSRLNNLRVVCCGDLKDGRTVRSLCYLLGKYEDIHITFVAPSQLQIKQDILDYLDRHNVTHQLSEDLAQAASMADVVYQTRVQKERKAATEVLEFNGRFTIDQRIMDALPASAIVMHPLPRVDEIDPIVDTDPRAAYFRQAQNGLFVRMALLKMILT